jgi:hypothetical protein
LNNNAQNNHAGRIEAGIDVQERFDELQKFHYFIYARVFVLIIVSLLATYFASSKKAKRLAPQQVANLPNFSYRYHPWVTQNYATVHPQQNAHKALGCGCTVA